MRHTTLAGILLILAFAAPVHAQNTIQQKAHAARLAEIRRENYAKQQAIQLLFGPRGIPALTRPSDPWNYQRPRYFYRQPNNYGYTPRVYYR